MAMWTHEKPTLGQTIICLLNSDKFLKFSYFPFLCCFFLSYIPHLSNAIMHLLMWHGISFPFLRTFIMCTTFLKTLIPEAISPQHYWWFIPKSPSQDSIVFFDERTSFHIHKILKILSNFVDFLPCF